ncbi:hypothetical protein PUN28_005996 [Cardiocondyla obscurior]|uniref:GATA zinc finger domain-containing protein 14-like n=1 Tax=Cardiocondyla obscurior TaxID=286306 RepID=A0AAW2GBJ4_9HYME
MASVSSVSQPEQGQHSFRFYWTLCNSTLTRIGEYCKLASGKIKAVVYRQEQDGDKKIEDKLLALTETIKAHLSEESKKCPSSDDKTHSCDDTMPENNENMWNKNIDTANLLNTDKPVDPKNEEDVLSIVESIVTAHMEAEFCKNKPHEGESSTSKSNTEDVKDAVNPSNSSKTDEKLAEKLTTHFDGNNNNSKSATLCILEKNDKPASTCKTSNTEKDKDMQIQTDNTIKTSIKDDSNINLTKDNEKYTNSSNDSKKAVCSTSKPVNNTDKNGKDYFNNKQSAKTGFTKKQEFVKQRNVPKNGMEKESKNFTKLNLTKTGVETVDTICQNKNSNKDKTLQKQQPATSKQFTTPKVKNQEPFRKNTSTFNCIDNKNKTEKTTHTSENAKTLLNESEGKTEKIYEKNVKSDPKMNRSVDFKRNNTFVAQYRNSMFSKPSQHISRTGQGPPMYGRNPFVYNNSKFDKTRNCSTEYRVKKEHVSINAPVNAFTKSSTATEELDTGNVENFVNETKEITEPINVNSTLEVNTLEFNDKKDMNVKMETNLTQNEEDTNVSVDCREQQPTTSKQCSVENRTETNISQAEKINNEETNSIKCSSNVVSGNYTTASQINPIHPYSSKAENLESNLTTWNQPSENAVQKGATIPNLQQSMENMHFNTQQNFPHPRNSPRQMSTWEPNNSRFYDQHFSAGDMMRMPQIPNMYNALPYEFNTQISSDNSATATPALETTINSNRENSNVIYRYESNVPQRSVMASEFPGHSVSCQTNEVRWSVPVQDGFHDTYVTPQPTMIHVYNPAVFNPDDFNNTHAMDYVSHPIIYAPTPYLQTWNSQLQYPMPVMYNSPCTNYTTISQTSNQSSNFNNPIQEQQYKQYNSYVQPNNYVRDTYNDTNSCVAQPSNTADNIPIKSNYYKNNSGCTVYNVPRYAPPVSYSRTQQGMNFVPPTSMNHNASYCSPHQKYYKPNVPNYMKNAKSRDFVCDDNGTEDIPPMISPTEFVTNNLPIKTSQFATPVFKPEFKTKSNSGYRSTFNPSFQRSYNGGFRRHATFQDLPKEYTHPMSIGRGSYKVKKT